MDPPPPRPRPLVYAAELVALTAAYIALGKLGLGLSAVSGFASLIWPPAGLSLAALVLRGYRLWPAVAVGAFVTNLWAGGPVVVAFAMAVGNALEAVVGAFALRRVPGFRPLLDRVVDVLALAVLAAMLSTLISATIGTLSLELSGLVSPAGVKRTWLVWWTGDVMSCLIITPVLLTWPRIASAAQLLLDVVAPAVATAACAVLVFLQRPETSWSVPLLLPYVVLLPLIWAALRSHANGAAIGMLVVTIVAVAGTVAGLGFFARPDRIFGLVSLNVFLASASLATLVLGAVVSEREESRRSARESEAARANLASLVESSADAVIGKACDGTITSWNAAAERLYGYTRAEAIGRSYAMLVPPERRDEVPRFLARVGVRGEHLVEHETVRVRKDGTKVMVSITLSPIRDASGAITGISAIARDIGLRKRMEEELRQGEERLRLAVLAAGLGTWCWEPTRGSLDWSPLCRWMHGLGEADEVSYARLLSVLHPDDRERTEPLVARSLEERTDYDNEYRVIWPDGSVHWVKALGRPFYDEASGVIDRMIGVAMDITAERRAEQERAALLERERAARAEAQAATRAKDDFLAILSHELRTPLQAVLGWTQMLRSKGADAGLSNKALQAIERNAVAQGRLIEDLLDVSRIVTGKLRVNKKPLALDDVVVPVLESARADAVARSILLEERIEAPGTVVIGDIDRLRQVLWNLLTNALKFTPKGGRVAVRLEREGPTARIVVEDTGSGISPEFLPHVFDRFRQAESTAARSHGGLGLGLAIVRHLVELHGGTVKAESEGEGRGARFTVVLPAADGREVGPRAPKPKDGSGQVRAALGGARVLVVDDDADACELFEAALVEAGAEVRAARSSSAAIEALGSFRADLVLSDIGMPGEDGYELVRHVRERDPARGRRLPVVAVTAFASQADREHALAAGFDAHLTKPISPDRLVRAVAGVLGRCRCG